MSKVPMPTLFDQRWRDVFFINTVGMMSCGLVVVSGMALKDPSSWWWVWFAGPAFTIGMLISFGMRVPASKPCPEKKGEEGSEGAKSWEERFDVL